MKLNMPKLINNWQSSWKLASMWVLTALMVLPQAALLMDAETRAGMPLWLSTTISVLSFVGIVVRLVQQGRPSETPE